MATSQTQAVNLANQLISLSTQLMSIYNQIVSLDNAWNDQGTATVLAALGTVAQNTDGSLGANDPSPVTTHPINPSFGMTRAVSSLVITQNKTILDAVRSLIEANAVSAQTGARGILNSVVG